MDIRNASPGESAQVIVLLNDLIVELGGDPLSVERAVATVDSFISGELSGEIIVAADGDDLVGVCTLTYQPSIRTLGIYGIIQEMYVKPEFRSNALGEGMIEKALSTAEQAGCLIVELSTPPDGKRAESFYRRLGFGQVGVRMRYKY